LCVALISRYFGPDGGSSSSSEAVDAAVELRLAEHRLDHRLALAVALAAALPGEDSAHERVRAARPAPAPAVALAGVGRIDDIRRHSETTARDHTPRSARPTRNRS
jgi:hypothetical protein